MLLRFVPVLCACLAVLAATVGGGALQPSAAAAATATATVNSSASSSNRPRAGPTSWRPSSSRRRRARRGVTTRPVALQLRRPLPHRLRHPRHAHRPERIRRRVRAGVAGRAAHCAEAGISLEEIGAGAAPDGKADERAPPRLGLDAAFVHRSARSGGCY